MVDEQDDLPDEIMREVGTNWFKRYAALSDHDDPAFVAACVYRVMRWAKRRPDDPSLAHLMTNSVEQTTDLTDSEITAMASRSRLMRELDARDAARRRRGSPPADPIAASSPRPLSPQDSTHAE